MFDVHYINKVQGLMCRYYHDTINVSLNCHQLRFRYLNQCVLEHHLQCSTLNVIHEASQDCSLCGYYILMHELFYLYFILTHYSTCSHSYYIHVSCAIKEFAYVIFQNEN